MSLRGVRQLADDVAISDTYINTDCFAIARNDSDDSSTASN